MSILTEAAKNRDCQIRSDHCNYDNTTTVLAHLNGAGMGIKHHDLLGAHSCSACHDYVDSRTHKDEIGIVRLFMHLRGIARTINLLIDEQYIQIVKPVAPKIKKFLPRNY